MPGGKSKPFSGAMDAQIGARIREARIMKGLKREDLAEFLGVTVPQVQKYETGGSRLAASALFALAKFLETDVRFFYEGVDVELPGAPQTRPVRIKE